MVRDDEYQSYEPRNKQHIVGRRHSQIHKVTEVTLVQAYEENTTTHGRQTNNRTETELTQTQRKTKVQVGGLSEGGYRDWGNGGK